MVLCPLGPGSALGFASLARDDSPTKFRAFRPAARGGRLPAGKSPRASGEQSEGADSKHAVRNCISLWIQAGGVHLQRAVSAKVSEANLR